jgi:predicted nucleotidyltransferase
LDQDLVELFDHAIRVLEELGIPYAIGGSVATLAYGKDRGTQDLDVVILLDEKGVSRLLAGFPYPDFYWDLEAARTALRTGGTFNVIYGRAKVDFFPAKGFIERNQVERAKRLRLIGGQLAQVSGPEELIAKKMEYYDEGGSDKHLSDIAAMLQSSTIPIDRERVAEYARHLRLSHLWTMVMRRADETNPDD